MIDASPLTDLEKRKLLNCFYFNNLSNSDKEFFYNSVFSHLDEFPILNRVAREYINTGQELDFFIKRLDEGVGCCSESEIAIDKSYWNNAKNKKDTRTISGVFWHELVHAVQNNELKSGKSKRGFMVFRQFIEAEAMSYSNLIKPQSRFEEQLYRAIREKFSSEYEAQRYYIGVSSKLRLNADRELAKIDAQNIMGKYFSQKDWIDSESRTMKHWKNFYYKYHGEYAETFWRDKSSSDKDIIQKCEEYFKTRYGLNISPKSSISKEVIDSYNLDKDIHNTILINARDEDVFDFKKWREIKLPGGGSSFVLDLPDMDKNHPEILSAYMLAHGVHAKPSTIQHRDGFSSRCLVIPYNDIDNVRKFLSKCGIKQHDCFDNNKNKSSEKNGHEGGNFQPIKEKRVVKGNQNLSKGDTVLIDTENLPCFYVGHQHKIPVSLNNILTSQMKRFVHSGGVLLIGRNPQSQHAKIPSELKNIRCESFKIPNSDNYVSNVQGYFFADQYGNILYKDTSSNGLKMETYLTAKDEKMDEKVKTLFVGQSMVIDEKTPLLLSFGSANKTFFDTNILFSKENKNHLQNGGVFVIGRNPWSKSVQYPSELKNKYIKEMMLKNADDSVSRIQGYFFMDKNGCVQYKNLSINGTRVEKNCTFKRYQYASKQTR